jgi:uncharacterized protein
MASVMDLPEPISSFYDAMHRGSARDLLSVLGDDFVGHVSAGLPGIGGTHTGGREMLKRAWLPAYATYGVLPHPEECLTSSSDRVIVLGSYRGVPPATGRKFEAAFAHVFRLRGDLISELQQITDSQRWVEAASTGAGGVAIVRQVFDAVRKRDIKLLLDAYADDIVIEEAPALPYGGEYRGREGALAHAAGFASAWGQLQTDDEADPREEILESAGTVAAVWTLKASRGDERLAQRAVSHFEIRAGKVSRLQMLYHDTAAILQFLGSR